MLTKNLEYAGTVSASILNPKPSYNRQTNENGRPKEASALIQGLNNWNRLSVYIL